jgi:hypothetical protein
MTVVAIPDERLPREEYAAADIVLDRIADYSHSLHREG